MKKHKKIVCGIYPIPLIITAGILICLLFFPVPAARAELLSLREVVTKIQERYEKTGDLKARFVQEITIKALKKSEKEEGVIYIKNPKRMLWHYLKPKVKKLIINPEKAWLYVPEDRVAYVQNAEDVLKSKLTVKLLSGIGKLDDDFNVSFSGEGPVDAKGNYLVTLIPKESGLGVDRLFLTIDKDTFLMIQCRFSDMYGNVTRIRFTDIKTNTSLSDRLFAFRPPQGVEVYNLP
ncbi:MAG: outer membrane lipoprotein carrier protein LolA [Deltaproteobacteria bacterium]